MKVFHHNDPDGFLSAFLVRVLEEDEITHSCTPEDFIEMDYNKPFPIDKVSVGEHVYIVDFSISPTDMLKLMEKTSNIVWIDHHKSAIETYKNFPEEELIKGTRIAGEDAACALVEKYFIGPECELWEVTKLVSDYDAWIFKYGDRTKHFRLGLDGENWKVCGGIWQELWNGCNDKKLVSELEEKGRIKQEFKNAMSNEIAKRALYYREYQGHPAAILNTPLLGSPQFECLTFNQPVDIFIAWFYNGKEYRIGFYNNPYSGKKVDVSLIAKELGGGGHPGAAGAFVSELPKELK